MDLRNRLAQQQEASVLWIEECRLEPGSCLGIMQLVLSA